MRFLVDASADARLVPHLRNLGHDVARVGSEHPGDLKDDEVLALAASEKRILIADDRDFGELVFVRRQSHTGVICFRLSTTRFTVRRDRLDAVLASHGDDLGQFLIITERTIRVRALDRPSEG